MKTQIIALHGFLGNPADWDPAFARIREAHPQWELRAMDFMNHPTLRPDQSMESWAQNFCQEISTWAPAKRILVGYSMGGRLALHAVHAQSDLWQGALFLSTHPGLSSQEAKNQRLLQDQVWAQRFLQEDLTSVLKDWNAQSVFAGTVEVARLNLDSALLAGCLEHWSLGRQRDFRLENFRLPQIWAAGEKDKKFSGLLETFSGLQTQLVAGVGHRLLAEAPGAICQLLTCLKSSVA